MSAQMALMGVSAVASVASAASSISGGYKTNDAYRNKAKLEAASLELQKEENALQTALQEQRRRREMGELIAINAFDAIARGVGGGAGSSSEALQSYNMGEGEKDVANIRLMGEARGRRLSFARQQTLSTAAYMGQSAIENGWMQGISTLGGTAMRIGGWFNFGGGDGSKGSNNTSPTSA